MTVLNMVIYLLHFGASMVFSLATLLWLFFVICSDSSEERKENIKSLLKCVILAVVFAGTFSVLMISYNKTDWKVEDQPYATEQIVSLNDNNMVHGRIYVRRGYINEDLYYQYMVKLNNGGFKANKVRSSGTTLYYDNDNCRVEWYRMHRKYWYLSEEKTCWKIYVPEGSISDDYAIDLQ